MSKPSVRVPANVYLEEEHKSWSHPQLFVSMLFDIQQNIYERKLPDVSHIIVYHFRIITEVAPYSHMPRTDAGNKNVRIGWP